jgi:hypothetical protein
MDDFERLALGRLRPYLGSLVDEPEEVDGRHPGHRGQTFDYFAERTDGQRLAIEITGATDQEWMQDAPAWRGLAERVEASVQEQHPAVTGIYLMAPLRVSQARANDYAADALAGVVAKCFAAGLGARAVSDDAVVRFRYFRDQPDLVVVSSPTLWEFEGAPESEVRFRKALTHNVAKMQRAGEAGYETHLAVVHWTFGTTHTWRQSLAQKPPAGPHPQNIWAVDLIGKRTQGRQPAEQIWPIQ